MADEIVVSGTIRVKKGNIVFPPVQWNFQEDMEGSKGMFPGLVVAKASGTLINFRDLPNLGNVRPRRCVFINYDETNFVTVGVYDGSQFYPFGEIAPLATENFPLSRYFSEEFVGTGTGTNADHNYLMLVGDTADCNLYVGAWER